MKYVYKKYQFLITCPRYVGTMIDDSSHDCLILCILTFYIYIFLFVLHVITYEKTLCCIDHLIESTEPKSKSFPI